MNFFVTSFFVFVFCSISWANFELLINQISSLKGMKVVFPSLSVKQVDLSAAEFDIYLEERVIKGSQDVSVYYDDFSVKSKEVNYNLNSEELAFFDDVTFSKNLMTLDSEAISIFFPDKVYANGDVEFVYKDYFSNSKQAFYNSFENVIVLKGDAVLYDQDDFFRGESISFDLNQQKVISKGRSRVKLSTDKL